MANPFSYIIKDQEGKTTKGVIEAESKEKLIEHFHKQGCLIFSIEEAKKAKKPKRKRRVKTDDLVIFSRQFTTLIESGIPAVECLAILTEQVEQAYFKEVISSVLRQVKEGAALSASLANHKDVFPDIYLSMVEAAEVSGNLPEILNRVSIYLEKSSALKKKVISALYYPIVIVFMAIAITSFLIFKVIPTFKEIFSALGGALPLPTQILIKVSDLVRQPVVIITFPVLIFGGSVIFKNYIKNPKGKRRFHRFILKLPVFGDLIRKISIAKFSRTFSTLVRSGVPILKCLEIVAKTSGNTVIEDAVMESKQAIQDGQPISIPLEKTGVFPPMVTRMVSIGEKSGRLEEMLSKIAQFYEEQTDAMVAGLSSLIEPIVIAFLGVIVGGIVISLFLPIIKITQYIGGVH
ncbi:MAG: type II secretion system F family protein [Candidatus Omnitrophica bacterium]|nr:type II secretion system F family protein [Candidatus Omnitrophota bacterium]MBU2043821.1 type II secretion system F family protein [Candidatus Omnitrophota bacterium]MBU2251136.1 type II secretion system F family protein [Candidatus Omnitrophota bacterium]MBU2265598.1 type II secretion system F family protein [Candidatus Omnitrophota bacterium]MBU2473159.1 type II secretion system F family protein [Candidatus Omnitrophota bacterium]